MSIDERYMTRALDLALKGGAYTYPNPLVGCVIVHNNTIIGEGCHRVYGEAHAEVNAINSVKQPELLGEATAYVTLEPCSHFGKTPPCANLLVEKKLKRVVICNTDPFEQVNGSGIDTLERAGIEVTTGLLAKKGLEINKRFFTFHTKKRPYVVLKWAQTLDGFINHNNAGKSPLQISNDANFALTHKWRSEEHGILVGYNTVLNDNPTLTTRRITGKNPIRIVIDWENTLQRKRYLNIFNDEAKTLVLNLKESKTESSNTWVRVESKTPQAILKALYQLNILSILIEGGTKTHELFLAGKLWDEARITQSNRPLKGGIKAPHIEGTRFANYSCGNNNTVSIFSPLLV
jgi:diaminohydroxyphosphoribosylaminopyrimidine deaminase/5-amino-6-(5-phosphoribosylamino)uracil reductase